MRKQGGLQTENKTEHRQNTKAGEGYEKGKLVKKTGPFIGDVRTADVNGLSEGAFARGN